MANFDLKIFTENIEPDAVNQVYTLMGHPAFREVPVRIMPDVHSGKGCVIGFTAPMSGRVVPNIIGVDIGCGMLTIELGERAIDFAALDAHIRNTIPLGMRVHTSPREVALVDQLHCLPHLHNLPRIYGSCGSLGGGNHFIEIDRGDDGQLYLVIHSGSRNLGLQVAEYYQAQAIEYCKSRSLADREALVAQYKREGRVAEIADALKALTHQNADYGKTPNELCFLEGPLLDAYLHDMRLCQVFAQRNRQMMAESILRFLGIHSADSFETIHNFIDDHDIIRKGAIPAYEGQKVLIPMNMRDGCLVAIGKGNPDWNCSAPHGAGRIMSRGQARRTLSLEDFRESMEGIFTTSVEVGTLDESPMVYKPMDEIVACIEPTVTIEQVIRPIYNLKASS